MCFIYISVEEIKLTKNNLLQLLSIVYTHSLELKTGLSV